MSAIELDASAVKAQALALGFQTVGVCNAVEPPHFSAYDSWVKKGHHGEMDYLLRHLDLKRDPSLLLPGAQSVVATTSSYYQPVQTREGAARIARYALGRDYHSVLRGRLAKLGKWITESYPGSSTRACVDSAPIMERDFAELAGLGFYGKNTMLIDPERGSWFFIGLLLTTLRFRPDPQRSGGCGTCTKCIDACPTGAIEYSDGRWQVAAKRCVSYLTIEHRGEIDEGLQGLVGDWTFGCDTCQEVCPFNTPRGSQPLRSANASDPNFRAEHPSPDLHVLADIDYPTWDRLTRGRATRRATDVQWRRNAAINLKNLDQAVRR